MAGATSVPDAAESRNWAMAVHLTALAGAFIGGIGAWVGPLVIWLLRRDSDPFAAEHAREGLNFNITVVIGIAAAFLATILTLGLGLFILIPLGVVFGVMWLVWTIQATVAASRGEHYRYPISIRMIR